MRNDPRVDVIIPLSQPDTLFYNCVKRLLKQTLPVGRIIISCKEGTGDPELISDKMEVHLLPGADSSVSDIKNHGAGFSDADIIVFISPRAKPYNKYMLERLVAPLVRKEGFSASYARTLARGDCNEPERNELIYYYPRTSFAMSSGTRESGRVLSPLGYDCAAYVKEAFERAQGYDKSYYSEDTLLALELMVMGEKAYYCGDAVVVASDNLTPLGQFKRYFDIGVFRKNAMARYGFGLDAKDEARLGIKGAMSLLDYKEYLWMGYDFFYKGAKYMGYIFGNSVNVLPRGFRSIMSSHPEQFKKQLGE